MYGHTHMEELEVVRAYEDSKPIGVNIITSSFTSYTGHNPTFRVITLDVKTKLPLKVETYTFDLEKANKEENYEKGFIPTHELAEEYDMKDLRPSEFLKFTDRLLVDERLATKYMINTHSNGPKAKAYAKG